MPQNKIIFILLSIICFIFSACKKFDKDEAIPAYIHISKCILSCDSVLQGSTQHNISDVWVSVDGNIQGTYELPVTFPVIAEGEHALTLKAGIKVNGISANRATYPFYQYLTIDTTLTPDNILELTPVYTYRTETIFEWLENFQNNGFSLDRSTKSDTTLDTTLIYGNQICGIFHIDANRNIFQYQSTEAYNLPTTGGSVYIEFDYECDHPFTVGLLVNNVQNTVESSILTLNPHPQSFNHVYVDLTYTCNQNPNALDFNIFFGAILESGYSTGEVKIDNIKLLHF
jgi:hypothetical protein